jgi:hypothetical protein
MAKNNPRKLETWEPKIGQGIQSFISGIDFLKGDTNRQSEVIGQARRILSRCANPKSEVDRKCALVLGQVQSGKTLSFTSLIALSRDNEIPLTILLGGTKRPLMQQNFQRLQKDLTLDSQGSAQKWLIKKDAKLSDKEEILAAIKSHEDKFIPSEYKQSVVLVIMKNKPGISKIENLLRAVQKDLGSNIPVLVIDDEGDQASPNTKQEKDERSATYSAIWNLRDALPNHSFLSYTATPEANLLVELGDILSPDSVVVLTPGEEYLGGYELFVHRASKFVNIIPEEELEIATNPNSKDGPPKSLVEALAYFLISLCVAQKAYPKVRPISMLIHPDSKIDSHYQYKKWVKSILDRWILHFENIEEFESKNYRIPVDFELAIQEIRKTISLEEIFERNDDFELELMKLVRYWINSDAIEVRVVNSANASNNVTTDEWPSKAGWILIGAGKLDRGFVVEKLTVTYMPRGRGGGNVDTIQQRGRFFGYKKGYQELLRGWMSADLMVAYRDIVETEKEMREELEAFDRNALQLQDWRRNMFMAYGLAPTRKNVISMNHTFLDLKDNSWFQQKRLFDPILESLQSGIEESVQNLFKDSEESNLDNRTNSKKHSKIIIALPELLDLLIDWPIVGEDRISLDKHILLLSKFSRNESQTHAEVFFMNQLEPRERSAEKQSEGNRRYWSINNLHEGRNSSSKGAYIGDAAIRSTDAITLQIHKVSPRVDKASDSENSVYAIALAWPNGFRKRVLAQL